MKAILAVGLLVFLWGCSGDEDPSKRAELVARMSGTWVIGQHGQVILNGEDVTASAAGFTLTIATDLSYVSNADQLSVDVPWATSGAFSLDETSGRLSRDDGASIDVRLDDGGRTLTLSSAPPAQTLAGDDRTLTFDGAWVFTFTN